MTRPVRRYLMALVAMVAAACGGTAVPDTEVERPVSSATVAEARSEATRILPTELDGLQAAMDAIAAAFADADPDALRPYLHEPNSEFGQRWLARAGNLAEVPLAHYALEVDPSLPDLATDRVRERYGEDARVVYVVEEHALEEFDELGPAYEDMFLTVIPDGDGDWVVAGDEDAEPLGLVTVDHLWDHGPVTTTRQGPILALHHPGTRNLPAVVSEAVGAMEEVRRNWPLSWPGQVPMIVPRSQDELAELLHVTFDLSNFIAFATATPKSELGTYELTGSRIVINPDRFLDRASSTRRSILAHELLHVATRRVSGPMVPSWLEEGVAQALGEDRSTTGTRLLSALVVRGFDGSLPTDSDFTTGGRDNIFLSYQKSWSFVEYLRGRFGDEQVARFYESAGRGAVGEPGTEAWHVSRAAREVFGVPLADLQAAWRDSLG
ncbi:MAG: hypothetical protein R3343_04855 [Nitriliruptorales bacterium]|nr:hypothetical protein [Nitriliruptorales bacterium]